MLSLTTNVWGETTSTLVEAIQLEQVDSLNQESLHRNSQGVSKISTTVPTCPFGKTKGEFVIN
jgi:hypothetical protein